VHQSVTKTTQTRASVCHKDYTNPCISLSQRLHKPVHQSVTKTTQTCASVCHKDYTNPCISANQNGLYNLYDFTITNNVQTYRELPTTSLLMSSSGVQKLMIACKYLNVESSGMRSMYCTVSNFIISELNGFTRAVKKRRHKLHGYIL